MNAIFNRLRHRLSQVTDTAEARALTYLLLEQGFGVTALDVYTDKVKQFSAEEEAILEQYLQRLEAGEPIQYVLGNTTFAGRSFIVSPAVLIPRPETEELVTWVVADGVGQYERIIDGGTGSGCIAISLALAFPTATVAAWDISCEALSVAQRNAHRLSASVTFEQMDLLQAAQKLGTNDLLVSNPPYVRKQEACDMAERVLAHEPHLALFVPDHDPLRFYRALAATGAGTIYCEINEFLSTETKAVFEAQGYTVTLRHDTFEKPRMLKAVLHHLLPSASFSPAVPCR